MSKKKSFCYKRWQKTSHYWNQEQVDIAPTHFSRLVLDTDADGNKNLWALNATDEGYPLSLSSINTQVIDSNEINTVQNQILDHNRIAEQTLESINQLEEKRGQLTNEWTQIQALIARYDTEQASRDTIIYDPQKHEFDPTTLIDDQNDLVFKNWLTLESLDNRLEALKEIEGLSKADLEKIQQLEDKSVQEDFTNMILTVDHYTNKMTLNYERIETTFANNTVRFYGKAAKWLGAKTEPVSFELSTLFETKFDQMKDCANQVDTVTEQLKKTGI